MNPLEQRVAHLEAQLAQLLKSDRMVLERTLQMADGRSIQVGTTTGTRIATATTQKLGFWGLTPVTQPAASVGSSATNVHSTGYFASATYGNAEKNMLNYLWQGLVGAGLLKETA
jgi:hypothetical protein